MSDGDPGPAPRRPRGRPQVRPDDETLGVIVEAARMEFLANGFGSASMAAVAQRAGVSTKTLYRLMPTKADLFRQVVSIRMERFILEIDLAALDALDPAEALSRILTIFGELTLGEEATILYGLVLTESARFPELASSFFEMAIEPTGSLVETWLRRQCERGILRAADPKLASGMLRGMMLLEPQRAFLLGQQPLPSKAEIAARACACAELFLRGCRA